MKTYEQFSEDKEQSKSKDKAVKLKGKKDVKLKKGSSVTIMPKHPDTPDKALGVKE